MTKYNKQGQTYPNHLRSLPYSASKLSLRKKCLSNQSSKTFSIFYNPDDEKSNNLLLANKSKKDFDINYSYDGILLQSSCLDSFCGFFNLTSQKVIQSPSFNQNIQFITPKVPIQMKSSQNQFFTNQNEHKQITSSLARSTQKHEQSFLRSQKSFYSHQNSTNSLNQSHLGKSKKSNCFQNSITYSQSSGIDFKRKFLTKKTDQDVKVKHLILKQSCFSLQTCSSIKRQNITFEQQTSGCLCLPQCFWIQKWLRIIKTTLKADSESFVFDLSKKIQIQKDVLRSRGNWTYFREQKTLNHLTQVLTRYCLTNLQTGYVQGMNLVASAIVFHSNSPAKSSEIFNFIMIEKKFQSIYQGDLSLSLALALNLLIQLKQYQPSLYHHITKSGIQVEWYIRTLYFSMLGQFVPLEYMHLIIDKFIKNGFQGINRILLSLLLFMKTQIFQLKCSQLEKLFTIGWLLKHTSSIDWIEVVGFSGNIAKNYRHF